MSSKVLLLLLLAPSLLPTTYLPAGAVEYTLPEYVPHLCRWRISATSWSSRQLDAVATHHCAAAVSMEIKHLFTYKACSSGE
jgi:hypothetical protein